MTTALGFAAVAAVFTLMGLAEKVWLWLHESAYREPTRWDET
jgi:hypothetical protein